MAARPHRYREGKNEKTIFDDIFESIGTVLIDSFFMPSGLYFG